MGDLISRSRLKAELESWAQHPMYPAYYSKEDADFVIDAQPDAEAVTREEYNRLKNSYERLKRITKRRDEQES